ncbi:uncharacterized protein LOC123546029 [Mercenaria mercenaria]|uniref:uncharacterized protein LOC123546029 n=1 Tax=Mercenaria mercenaria TaxID=6596 RepID=UPI00234E3F28|nr:uncharacterized protein LOC123546029 [Mercenaria mercenaria]
MASLSTVCSIFCVIVIYSALSEQASLSRRYSPNFEDGQTISTLNSHDVREASGICASRIHPNILYTHNDSGDHSHSIYAIDVTSGRQVAKITINHAVNKDWEDIACGPCPGNHGDYCIYIADTGGNVHDAANIIYRIKEPETLNSHFTVDLDSSLKFRWSEQNCETVMVDPLAELYVVSKVHGGKGKMVKLPSSAWGSSHTASVSGGIHLNGIHSSRNDPVAGDISPTGYEVLIKTLGAVNYYYVPDGDYLKHMSGTPEHLPYHHEMQGESIAWDPNVRGYYTLGEGTSQPIYFYKRVPHTSLVGK